MKKKLKNIIVICVFLSVLIGFIAAAGNVTMPKRYEYGANWGAFRQEQQDSFDAIFFGSSLAYCNVIPAIIWENSGISTYVMAGPEQTPAVTYYYVKEMFRTQQPSAVLVEVSDIHMDAKTGQDSIKVNLGYMPYGLNRLCATFRAAPKEQRMGLIFPLYNYHDRWEELSPDDWHIGLSGYDKDLLAGYDFLDDVEAQTAPRQRNFSQTDREYADNLVWFQKISSLCQKHDCRCIFYVSASYAYFEESYLQKMRNDLTADGFAEFFNSMEDIRQLAPDPATDFHDILHFNYRGAEKYSRQLANKLTELDIEAKEPYADAKGWQERLAHYRDLIADSEAAKEK